MSGFDFAVIGINHGHIDGQVAAMADAGCRLTKFYAVEDDLAAKFAEKYGVPRVRDEAEILGDDAVKLVVGAGIPCERGPMAVRAMQAGKDVMVDKPGCTTLEQLDAIKATVAETGRIWSIDFSERFEVPSVGKAAELVRAGAIGKVVQTVGLGPHRLNRHTREDWFFQQDQYGGVLCDIASHQIDQFLFFTGSDDAEIVASSVGNFANPDDPGLEDFGEVLLRSDKGRGYIRVDWYTPDALPTWGDGRLTILGTEGTIELRKYVDIAGRPGTDHVFLVNGERYEHIDGAATPLTYFRSLANDIRDRTETAMSQAHCFKVMELALKAQAQAAKLGNLKGA